LARSNVLQLVSHRGTDSVTDLGLLSRNKMLPSVWTMVVSASAVCSLCRSFQVTYWPWFRTAR